MAPAWKTRHSPTAIGWTGETRYTPGANFSIFMSIVSSERAPVLTPYLPDSLTMSPWPDRIAGADFTNTPPVRSMST